MMIGGLGSMGGSRGFSLPVMCALRNERPLSRLHTISLLNMHGRQPYDYLHPFRVFFTTYMIYKKLVEQLLCYRSFPENPAIFQSLVLCSVLKPWSALLLWVLRVEKVSPYFSISIYNLIISLNPPCILSSDLAMLQVDFSANLPTTTRLLSFAHSRTPFPTFP